MRQIGLILIGIIISLGVIWGYRRFNPLVNSSSPQDDLQTAEVEVGTILATIFTVGNITPERDAHLAFTIPGTLKDVNVNIGDTVTAGQVLATLETVDLEWEIVQADLNLSIAQADLARLQSGPDEAAFISAEANLRAAQQVLTTTLAGPSGEEIQAARSALEAAQTTYDLLLSQPNPAAIRQAELQVEHAKNRLWEVQNQRDMACGVMAKTRSLCAAHEAVVGNGHVEIQLAELALEQAKKPASEVELQNASSQVHVARANLDKLLAGSNQAEITAAEAQVAQAQALLDNLATGPSAMEREIAELRLEQAELALQHVQQQLIKTILIAPFSGVVTAVNYQAGDSVRPEVPGINLADLSQLQIEVNVAEVDISQVQVGQRAEVVLDALPDQVIEGQVTHIAPAARSELGVVNYPVTITITQDNAMIRAGMTGNVSIVVGQKDEVLLVPNRAILRSQGNHMVIIMRGDQLVETPVQIGLSNETVTEVVGGLVQGDRVLLNSTTAQSGLRNGLFQNNNE